MSFHVALSSIASASSFLNCVISALSVRSRSASNTSCAPSFDFHRLNVAGQIPWLRQLFAVAAPASCSRSTPMILSSLNLDRFIRPPPAQADFSQKWIEIRSSGQTYCRGRAEHRGLKLDQLRRFQLLEQENGRLRRAVSDLTREMFIPNKIASGHW